ncbi:MAG TPA: hypothetical protein DCY20_12025 [Firmicutes bacterium]|nr:hypothetical protein [Bacillota bacterium]
MYPGQPKIIHMLSKHTSMTQVELAKIIGVTPATINVTLKRMEREELVQRNRSASDNRVTQVVLTEKGKELSNEVDKLMSEIQDITFGNFTDEEFLHLKHALQKLKDNLIQVCPDHHDCFKD